MIIICPVERLSAITTASSEKPSTKRLQEIERERAKARQACGQGGILLPENLPEASKGDSRDIAAKKLGMSANIR